MKRVALIILSKLIVSVSPALWRMRSVKAFYLHQYLGRILIRWHHKYKLNVLKDHEYILFKE